MVAEQLWLLRSSDYNLNYIIVPVDNYVAETKVRSTSEIQWQRLRGLRQTTTGIHEFVQPKVLSTNEVEYLENLHH